MTTLEYTALDILGIRRHIIDLLTYTYTEDCMDLSPLLNRVDKIITLSMRIQQQRE